jgi:hypothetical protein
LQSFPTLGIGRITKASLQRDDLSLPRRLEGLEEFRRGIVTRGKSVKRDVSDPMRIVPNLNIGRFAPPLPFWTDFRVAKKNVLPADIGERKRSFVIFASSA